jgi:hypothetical protein
MFSECSPQVDEFHLEGIDLGEIYRAVLKHDGSGLGDSWHLELLTVHHAASKKTFSFSVNQWLDKKNRRMVDLVPGDNQVHINNTSGHFNTPSVL